jgi:hypothetical protein
MGNIINDIVEDIDVKPGKSKLVVKWVVRISVGLIGVAFIIGQIKISHLNRLGDIEKSLNNNTEAIQGIKEDMNTRFDNVDTRIDNIYTDGFNAFEEYQVYNKKQLELIIDYGQSNKDLLKKMLDVNIIEKNKNVENNLENARSESRKKDPVFVNKNYVSVIKTVSLNNIDTTFRVTAANGEYVQSINKNRDKYDIIGEIKNNTNFPELFDFTYRTKNK